MGGGLLRPDRLAGDAERRGSQSAFLLSWASLALKLRVSSQPVLTQIITFKEQRLRHRLTDSIANIQDRWLRV